MVAGGLGGCWDEVEGQPEVPSWPVSLELCWTLGQLPPRSPFTPAVQQKPWAEDERIQASPGSPVPQEGPRVTCRMDSAGPYPPYFLLMSDFNFSFLNLAAITELLLHLHLLKFERTLTPKIVF